MLTKLYPMVQFKKDTWEIDEFDCASMFLLVGSERALLIDCGMGVGDLRGAVEMLTDKPVTVVLSHGHVDHTGNARQFGEVWLHPADQGANIPESLEWRRGDVAHIAHRQKDCIGSPYTMFHLYPFDINVDLREPEEPMPVIRDLRDGQTFDLGGGRVVTAYECPGHTAGEMVFLDSATRTLIAGDALNYNLGLGAVPLETTLRALRRLRDMGDQYDGIYNGHHDFRALGAPLDDDCLATVIELCERVVKTGEYIPCEVPSFWGAHVPLTRQGPAESGNIFAKFGKRVLLHQGRCFVSIDPENIREKK
ncbi:MAG: MBL fold metallo-hydrolase [Clostridia bacterium]|nr:MBL fold metallo-hydrolase [Clostridia bacterium]